MGMFSRDGIGEVVGEGVADEPYRPPRGSNCSGDPRSGVVGRGDRGRTFALQSHSPTHKHLPGFWEWRRKSRNDSAVGVIVVEVMRKS